jgi:hypothetical protein
VNCRGYNAFGRRRREIAEPRNSTDVAVSESIYEGQLREEITIQSNAILTFERREERFVDPTEGILSFPVLFAILFLFQCNNCTNINLNKL